MCAVPVEGKLQRLRFPKRATKAPANPRAFETRVDRLFIGPGCGSVVQAR
jgi:hypothetical protein